MAREHTAALQVRGNPPLPILRFDGLPLSSTDFLREPADLYPDKTAIVDGAKRFRYGRVARAGEPSSRRALLRLACRPGDRRLHPVAQSHYFLESFHATSQIGAVLVPLNYRRWRRTTSTS